LGALTGLLKYVTEEVCRNYLMMVWKIELVSDVIKM